VWLLALPFWVVVEVIYLIKHPRTYRRSAMLVGVSFAVLSYVLLVRGFPGELVYLSQGAAIVGYYVLKLRR